MSEWMVQYPAPATWGDVFVDQKGRIGCAYDHGVLGMIDFYEIQNDALVKVRSWSTSFIEVPLFIRAEKSLAGSYGIVAKGGDTGKFLTHNVTNINAFAYGTHSADLIRFGNGFRYAVQTGLGTYFDSEHGDGLVPDVIYGTSQGMIQLSEDGPVWSDLVRTSVPEMFYPFYVDPVIVGEGRTDPAHLQALEGDRQFNIYNGYAARPRACYDASTQLLAVAARGVAGVDFHFYRLPFGEGMACTPVVPPQNIVKDSTDVLRQFCQNYVVPNTGTDPNWHGRKPYVNDEIHTNGLFLADGLLYFMMSDTGRWAQVLMNPDDKRPWDQKRQSADAALQKYMKERVGDFS